jgi:hypothetical protein
MLPSVIAHARRSSLARPRGGRPERARAPVDPLTAFLLGGPPALSPEALRSARLAAYAYTVAPAGHPLRQLLHGDFSASFARHLAIRAELAPLVRAWRAAAIEVLCFKGFALSEWHYPVPGIRFHGDVDVLLHPEHLEPARRIAEGLGWQVDDHRPAIAGREPHDPYTLIGPRGAAAVDVHRFVIHTIGSSEAVAARITRAIWAGAHEREWEGTTVWEASPVDELLVLVLQRTWGSDRWHVRPWDVLDVRLLCEERGVRREALAARAHELGCDRTLELFWERCDPARGRVSLARPGPLRVWWWQRALRRESGGTPFALTSFGRLLRAPRAATDVIRAIPPVWRIRRLLDRDAQGTSVDRLVRALESLVPSLPAPDRDGPPERARIVLAVRRAARLLPLNSEREALVRAVTTYMLLRRHGWPVHLVCGERDGPHGPRRHAWVELHGRPLPELGEPFNRTAHRITLIHPPTPCC